MIELDLHGMRHREAEDALERTINGSWGADEELQIITGHSPQMKKIVVDILDNYRLQYTIGDFSGHNMGYRRTYLE